MTTLYDIGEKVNVEGVVVGIKIAQNGRIEYTVKISCIESTILDVPVYEEYLSAAEQFKGEK